MPRSVFSSHLGIQLPDPLRDLATLALDLRWSWSHGLDSLWEALDADLWRSTGSPWLVLQTVSTRRLDALARDAAFLAELKRHVGEREQALTCPCWLDRLGLGKPFGPIAYFSMEFGLAEALPLYSGGLGILAGDYLKTASDLGVPMIGIGLLYQQSYFRQAIDADGHQAALFPFNDPMMLPITSLRSGDGEWLRIGIPLPGRQLSLRCWEAVVGRNRLYLLDANDPVNSPRDRGITGELYGGNSETRLQQELVLGIGGSRLLEAVAQDVQVYHLNEGHAAFATVARAAFLMKSRRFDFATALTAARSGTLFTTHTPLAAAFDRFPLPLVSQYLQPLADELDLPVDQVLALGEDPDQGGARLFNMATLALHTAGAVNAVSAAHEAVSKRLFAPLFPRWPLADMPIGHVTNGVHVPSWDSAASDALWTKACGKDRWRGGHEQLEPALRNVPDKDLWECRCENRRRMVDDLAGFHRRQLARRGWDVPSETPVFDPNALTLGFARRFTGYKRTNLLLRDPARLTRLLSDPQRPVQLVLAGKADPRDGDGLRMIEDWIRFIYAARLRRGAVLFVEDYDMEVAAALTSGVDVWINTPRRPWEACGTSGMKVLVNGGLNLSVPDGWWEEAYEPSLGWAIAGDGASGSMEEADRRDCASLYELLEHAVVPEFFQRDESGIPRRWVARMRESMARLTPRFSGNRMLREYVERYYLPLARRYGARLENEACLSRDIASWQRRVEQGMSGVRLEGPVFTPIAGGWRVSALAYLGSLLAQDARLELYADPSGDSARPERITLERLHTLDGAVNGFEYEASLRTSRPPSHYTLRICPDHPAAASPLECPWILWGESSGVHITAEIGTRPPAKIPSPIGKRG